ncbi:MAG: LamG domain-containing protein [Candidatus Omnitrophica bacterium]|nr:LamG domain-containing protein [Candidatus Omnitrophota bacterium]
MKRVTEISLLLICAIVGMTVLLYFVGKPEAPGKRPPSQALADRPSNKPGDKGVMRWEAFPVATRQSLVLHLSFDQPGDEIKDQSDRGNNGKGYGTAWIDDGVGHGAYVFRGGTRGGFIRVPHSDSLVSMKKTGALTLSAWIKPYSIPWAFPVIISKGGNERPFAYGGYELALNANGDNDILFVSGAMLATTLGANGKWVNSRLQRWIHVVFTIDIETKVGVFYIDGVNTRDLQFQPNHPEVFSMMNFDVPNDLYIGKADPEGHENRSRFEGEIDEVMIFNRELSGEEVSLLYSQQRAALLDQAPAEARLASDAGIFVTMQDDGQDRAGVWNIFAPGPGNSNRDSSDWHWTVELNLESSKIVNSFTITHNNSGEAWSTSSDKMRGNNLYPLVVFNGRTQINTNYDQPLGTYSAGKHVFELFGQKESMYLDGYEVKINFADNSSVVAREMGARESLSGEGRGEYSLSPEKSLQESGSVK